MRFVYRHQLGKSADSATERIIVRSDPPYPRPHTQPETAIRWNWNTKTRRRKRLLEQHKQVELNFRGKAEKNMRCSPRRLSNRPPLETPENLGNRHFEVLHRVEKHELRLTNTLGKFWIWSCWLQRTEVCCQTLRLKGLVRPKLVANLIHTTISSELCVFLK